MAVCGLALLAAGCSTRPATVRHQSVPAGTPTATMATCSRSTPPAIGSGAVDAAPALASVEFVSAARGWVAGADRVLTTSDGGATWQRQYSGPAKLDQIDFIDATHGWAVGTNELLTTDDGGATWTTLPEPCGYIQSVHFVTPHLGYAIAAGSDIRLDGGVPVPVTGGMLLKTTDGGREWLPVRSAPARAQSVCFTSAANGFLGTAGKLWRSTDGGSHWSLSFSEPPQTGGSQHEPGDTPVLECAGNTAAWVLFLGSGAAMNHAPYIAYATQDARHWHVLFEEKFTESALMPEIHAPGGPGSYPGPFSAISPGMAAFLGWTPPIGIDGVTPLDLVSGGNLAQDGNVGGLSEAYGVAFISAAQGWVVGIDQTVMGKPGYDVIEATSNGGRSWTREYQVR
jgi:hypothetical protein